MMNKLDAMNEDIFNAYVDGNGDGDATLKEIEMVSIIFSSKWFTQNGLNKKFREWVKKSL